MCNHYRTANDQQVLEFAMRWSLDEAIDETGDNAPWEPVAEAWPWSKDVRMPVVYRIEAGNTLGFQRWGVWPFYEKQRPNFALTCNARDDSLLVKPIWKTSAKKRRCAIATDGWFEWTGPKGRKSEVLFHLPEEEPFFIAGIWAADPVGAGRGFAMVTCRPNAAVAALPHDRMPVLLANDGDIGAWLSGEELPATEVARICAPFGGALVRRDLPRREAIPRGDLRTEPIDLFRGPDSA